MICFWCDEWLEKMRLNRRELEHFFKTFYSSLNILFLYYPQISFLFSRKHKRIRNRNRNEIWISQSGTKINYVNVKVSIYYCIVNGKGRRLSCVCWLRFQWLRQPEHFLFCLERTMAVRCTPYNTIADGMNTSMASQLRRVLNTTPINFVVDDFFAYIIETAVGQLNFSLLTGHIIQWCCWLAWFFLGENWKWERKRDEMVFG